MLLIVIYRLVFYHICYEGSVDLDRVPDLAARHALEVQISEFGQIPKQLFDQPHVQRSSNCNANGAKPVIAGLQLIASSHSHKDLICCVTTMPAAGPHGRLLPTTTIMSTGKDGLLKWFDTGALAGDIGADGERSSSDAVVVPCRSVAIGALPLSACVRIGATNRLVLGSWNNSMYVCTEEKRRSSSLLARKSYLNVFP